MVSDNCDVLIIGAGPAGMATAISLVKNTNLSVFLVERSDFQHIKIGETIQPESRLVLERLGLWQLIQEDAHLATAGTASSWGAMSLGYNDAIFNPMGTGWHLNRGVFEKGMAKEAESQGVRLFRNTRFLSAKQLPGNNWQVEVKSDDYPISSIRTKFVVDASGRKAVFAHSQGAQKVTFDNLYGSFMFLNFSIVDQKTNTFTFIEATEKGWWYSALLSGNQAVAGFMTDGDILKELGLNRLENWQKHLLESKHTKRQLEGFIPFETPIVSDAKSYILDTVYGDAWMAIGDAAFAYDPLSSQGIIKALHSGESAFTIIADFLAENKEVLPQYERQIKNEFEQYLQTKTHFYGLENRWSAAPFWFRRHLNIKLHPEQHLQCNPDKQLGKLNQLMPQMDLELLCKFCETPKMAHQLVTEFKKNSQNKYSDMRIIQSLEMLVQKEKLSEISEKSEVVCHFDKNHPSQAL